MFWNTEKSTYNTGKRVYRKGDELPVVLLQHMGKETVDEYTEKGWIADDVKESEPDKSYRDELFEEAESLGLEPRYNTGEEKLKGMIEDHKAIVALRAEALDLGMEVSDDMEYADLAKLVDEKKNESDS